MESVSNSSQEESRLCCSSHPPKTKIIWPATTEVCITRGWRIGESAVTTPVWLLMPTTSTQFVHISLTTPPVIYRFPISRQSKKSDIFNWFSFMQCMGALSKSILITRSAILKTYRLLKCAKYVACSLFCWSPFIIERQKNIFAVTQPPELWICTGSWSTKFQAPKFRDSDYGCVYSHYITRCLYRHFRVDEMSKVRAICH